MDKLVVNGYKFSNGRDAKLAIKEQSAIDKIKETTDVSDTEGLFGLYNKLVSKNYFSTPVGIGFLHEMRDYLRQYYDDNELKPVVVADKREKPQDNSAYDINLRQFEKIKKENEQLIKIKEKLVIAVVAMLIIIVGMVFIVITNENLGYFNAEEKVLNKYSAWQERLESWEEELIRREGELNNQ